VRRVDWLRPGQRATGRDSLGSADEGDVEHRGAAQSQRAARARRRQSRPRSGSRLRAVGVAWRRRRTRVARPDAADRPRHAATERGATPGAVALTTDRNQPGALGRIADRRADRTGDVHRRNRRLKTSHVLYAWLMPSRTPGTHLKSRSGLSVEVTS